MKKSILVLVGPPRSGKSTMAAKMLEMAGSNHLVVADPWEPDNLAVDQIMRTKKSFVLCVNSLPPGLPPEFEIRHMGEE